MAFDSQPGTNEYGTSPKYGTMSYTPYYTV